MTLGPRVVEPEIVEGHVGHLGPTAPLAADDDGNVGVGRRLLEAEPGGRDTQSNGIRHNDTRHNNLKHHIRHNHSRF
jgi:hypothetical protein